MFRNNKIVKTTPKSVLKVAANSIARINNAMMPTNLAEDLMGLRPSQSSSSSHIFNKNKKTTSRHYFTIDDIYLLLISISLLNFFVSITLPILLMRYKRSKKVTKSPNTNNGSSSSSLIKITTINNNETNLNQNDFNFDDIKIIKTHWTSLASLHLMLPLIFFQGYIKTIFLGELNKWYVGCLNGSNHLNKLLICYGLSSFLSIICLTILVIFCRLKRNVSSFSIKRNEVWIVYFEIYILDSVYIGGGTTDYLDYFIILLGSRQCTRLSIISNW
jgi:hypothetical protein